MSRMGTEFKVGLFTLLGLVATGIAIFFVSPELFDRKEKVRFYTRLTDASGILENTHVKTNGVNIGRVASVKLDKVGTRVELEVLASVPIPQGSTVAVRTVGFLGDKFIDVVRASDSDAMLEPKSLIPPATDNGDIAQVIRQVGSIAADIKKVTENMATVLGDKSGEKRMQDIVDNLREVTENSKLILAENRSNLRDTVENFRSVSASLRQLANDENRGRVERILTKFDESMTEVRGASENIRLISQKIEKGEGTIGRLVNDDKTLTELEGAVKEIRQALSPVSKLQVGVDTHSELRQDNTSQTYFNIRLMTRPDAYYTLGFTDKNRRIIDTETETLDPTQGSTAQTRVRETIRDQRQMKFNLQMAKRWGWAAARLGLFESSGGVAGDIYLWRDRLKISMEAFDFAEKNDEDRRLAHLKAYASILFFDHLMATAGIDDPTRLDPKTGQRRKEPNYFLGAGLSFNDQDLKAFFGLATVAAAR